MLQVTWRVFLYALVAATSPIALTTTLVVLRSRRPRINGLLYAGAFLGASIVVLVLVTGLGIASSLRGEHGSTTLRAVLELVFGVALLGAAIYLRRHPERTARAASASTPRRPSRLTEMTERIGHLRSSQALGIGIALGIGGPKRLGITFVVAGTITSATLTTGEGIVVGASYVVVGTVLVWLPVGLYVIAGRRAEEWIASAQHWVSEHQAPLTFYPTLVVGLILVLDALVQLR